MHEGDDRKKNKNKKNVKPKTKKRVPQKLSKMLGGQHDGMSKDKKKRAIIAADPSAHH